jgi:signal transduction histidine kinase
MVRVKDSGIGIPEKEQEHIFRRFYRAKNAIGLDEQGSGLGLSVAKMMVESFGGTMGFESKEGSGSTFWFTIPFEQVS